MLTIGLKTAETFLLIIRSMISHRKSKITKTTSAFKLVVCLWAKKYSCCIYYDCELSQKFKIIRKADPFEPIHHSLLPITQLTSFERGVKSEE